jgi:transglutaminase-like putative cysteine protease
MRYTIRHLTQFIYESPITESVMEVRMQPRSEGMQRCLQFTLTTQPPTRVMMYRDHDGNTVHHFNVPARHSRLGITAEALVDCEAQRALPHRLGPGAWEQIDALGQSGEFWEYLVASAFAAPHPLLAEFSKEIGLDREHDPLVMLRRLMGEMYTRLEYSPKSTRVDSPIADALSAKRGVCQDFAHIFIALVRPLGVPARYVSGYLFHGGATGYRSAEGASHAWVEAFLPDLGWIGFDPTNNLVADDRHIRVAVGRDYADVPPTRGVFKGMSAVRSELGVSVRVGPVRPSLSGDAVPFTPWMSREATSVREPDPVSSVSQQQQQQQ